MPLPKLISAFLLLLFCHDSFCQQSANNRVKVFVDCSGSGCDLNYMRTEINLVDFLNERSAADVHILITSLTTGGGTEQYQLILYGQNNHSNRRDTLRFATKVNATQPERRENLVQYIKIGLLPFLINTPSVSQVNIGMKQTVTITPSQTQHDKWGYVVFNVNAEGRISADQNYTNKVSSAGFSMNRTTDKLRFLFGAYADKYLYTFKVSEPTGTTEYEVNNSDFGFQHYLVGSLSQHLSIGYLVRYSGNTFQNIENKFYLNPVLELNLFKYTDINNRSFLIRYGADLTSLNYIDTTLYNKKQENLFGHEASVSINFNQKWGSFSSGAYYRNYFIEPEFYSMGANVTFNIRIAGGLSFYVSGTGNIIHDQIYLKIGKATEQDILTRRRQLESIFDYYTSFGINFRFGSRLNNFVNQRVSGYRGV